MSTQQIAEDITDVILIVGFFVIVMTAIIFAVFVSFDNGELEGYCKAMHGKVEDGMCVKGDTIIKRGEYI